LIAFILQFYFVEQFLSFLLSRATYFTRHSLIFSAFLAVFLPNMEYKLLLQFLILVSALLLMCEVLIVLSDSCSVSSLDSSGFFTGCVIDRTDPSVAANKTTSGVLWILMLVGLLVTMLCAIFWPFRRPFVHFFQICYRLLLAKL